MRFVYDLTIPKDTAKVSPTVSKVALVKGQLIGVEVAFPPGPATLVHVVIEDGSFQIVPVNRDADLSWDDYTMAFPMRYSLTETGHELRLVGWSPDTTFDHKITFRFDVEPEGDDDERSMIQLLFGSGPRPQG
jgi:hypothetical protein